ncbi:hypothetical protein L1887_51171 [Cichorium endivia]|nr:hypothetical protein L1887_51171 [Cichorium endivia]
MCRPSQTPPPDNVFRPDRPAEANLGSKKRGIAPLPIHGISKITLKVVVFHFRPRAPTATTPLNRIPLVRTSSELAVRRPGKAPEGAVPSPSPGRHAATRSRRGSSSSSPPTADGFGTGTPRAQPSEPILFPSTTGRGRHSVLRIFKGRRGRTGHRATCGALPAAGPYLRLSHPHRRPLRPGSRPRFCSDPPRPPTHRGLALAPTAGVGRALKRHPFSGLVDSAGMLTLEPFSEDQGRSAVHPARGIPPISFLAPCGFTHPLTRTHVRLLGPCFKTGRMGCPQAGAGSTQVYRRDGACCQPRSTRRHLTSLSTARALAAAPIRTGPRPESDRPDGYRRSTSDRDASPAPIRFPPDNFKHSLTLFSKSFSSFPRGTCLLSVSPPVFSLGRNLPPYWGCIPKQPDSQTAPRGATGSGTTGLSPSLAPPSRGLGPGPPLRTLLQTTIRTARPSDFQAGLIPVRLAVTKGILVSFFSSAY